MEAAQDSKSSSLLVFEYKFSLVHLQSCAHLCPVMEAGQMEALPVQAWGCTELGALSEPQEANVHPVRGCGLPNGKKC